MLYCINNYLAYIMDSVSFVRRQKIRPNLLIASGLTRMLAAVAVLAALWAIIYWASLLP